MDVGRLRVLRELADRGSVTAVAAALSFTPSAISQQLRALTAEVGVPLTEPAGRGLRLTAAGQALVTQSEEVFTALARAQAAVDGLRSLPGGEVRMALFPSGARMLLAGVLRRMTAFPDVALRCRDVDMTPLDVPALAADYDVVVTHRDERTAAVPEPRFTVVPLLREPLDVVLPPGHPLARHRRLRSRAAGGRAVDQRGRRVAGRRRPAGARRADRDEPAHRPAHQRLLRDGGAGGRRSGHRAAPAVLDGRPRRPAPGSPTGRRGAGRAGRRGGAAHEHAQRPAVAAVLDALRAEAASLIRTPA